MDRQRTAERGQGIVEFAVIFPLLIAIIFVMIDGGLLMGRYNQVNHAAQEGARLAATGATSGQVVQRVRQQSIELLEDVPSGCAPGASERICVRWFDGPNGEPAGQVGSSVRVDVRYEYDFVTPIDSGPFGFAGVNDFDVNSCAIARLERPADSVTRTPGSLPPC